MIISSREKCFHDKVTDTKGLDLRGTNAEITLRIKCSTVCGSPNTFPRKLLGLISKLCGSVRFTEQGFCR